MVSSTISHDLVSRSGTSTLQKRFALPGEKIPRLTKNPTRAQVMSITNTFLMLDCPFTFVDVVPEEVVPHLETLLQTRHWMDRVARKSCLQWRTWTLNQFVYELRQAVPDSADARPHSSDSCIPCPKGYREKADKTNCEIDPDYDTVSSTSRPSARPT
jgi:hypothetical protein